jgi:hypothetical protein
MVLLELEFGLIAMVVVVLVLVLVVLVLVKRCRRTTGLRQ